MTTKNIIDPLLQTFSIKYGDDLILHWQYQHLSFSILLVRNKITLIQNLLCYVMFYRTSCILSM